MNTKRIFAIVLFAITLAVMLVAPGCGESMTLAERKASIITAALGPGANASGPAAAPTSAGPLVFDITDAQGHLQAYAVQMQVVSRSGPFTILVLLTPDRCVKRADVLHYPAAMGRAVRAPAFTRQFAGKCPKDPIRLNEDIDAATGATLSSEAMTNGVRTAVNMLKPQASM